MERNDVMKRLISRGFAAIFCVGLVACGGGDASDAADAADAPAPAAAPAPTAADAPSGGSLSMPDWMTVDEGAQTVTIDLMAGSTDAYNRWNYNGYGNGEATIVVPEGYEVTITFSNEDPATVHSVSVLDATDTMPMMFDDVPPVFDGAASSNPTSMLEATGAGASESFTFTASAAGDYALVCMIPAHAVTSMWIGFEVSASGESGIRM